MAKVKQFTKGNKSGVAHLNEVVDQTNLNTQDIDMLKQKNPLTLIACLPDGVTWVQVLFRDAIQMQVVAAPSCECHCSCDGDAGTGGGVL